MFLAVDICLTDNAIYFALLLMKLFKSNESDLHWLQFGIFKSIHCLIDLFTSFLLFLFSFLVVNELFFTKHSFLKIAYNHLLASIRYLALVADIRASQRVVTCDHHHLYLRLLQFFNRFLRLLLEFVFKDLEPIENDSSLCLIPFNQFYISIFPKFFVCNS